jgi:hypothetical protein
MYEKRYLRRRSKSEWLSIFQPLVDPEEIWFPKKTLIFGKPMKIVNKLWVGDCFGEKSLIDNRSRKTTIFCTEDTHFAIMDKTAYEATMERIQARNLNWKINFFSSLPFFVGWSKTYMTKFIQLIERVSFKKN